MATGLPSDIVPLMKGLMVCCMCHEKLVEPKSLPCFHTFCKVCLGKYVEGLRNGKDIEIFPCPTCRENFTLKSNQDVGELPCIHFIKDMLQLMTIGVQGKGTELNELDKTTKSPLTTQTLPASGEENVARSLFDKKSLNHNEATIVPVLGEPEGERKQAATIVTAQRQAAIGKSKKDTPTTITFPTGPKDQSPQRTNSPSTTTTSKPLMVDFTSPFVFGSGDSKQNFGLDQPANTNYSTQVTPSLPITKATTAPTYRIPTTPITQPTSQPTQRLGALGSGPTQAPPSFSAGFNISGLNLIPPKSFPSFVTSPQFQKSANPPPKVGVSGSGTPVKPVFGPVLRTIALSSTTTVTTMTSTFNLTNNKLVFGSQEIQKPNLLNPLPPSNPGLQPAQHASSTSFFTFGKCFGGNTTTTTSGPLFGTSTLLSATPSFGSTQSKTETPSSNVGLVFGTSPFGSQSQSTGFGAALSSLGGKPIEQNRNPFEVNLPFQCSNSSLFGSTAVSSTPNPFQSFDGKSTFGSTQGPKFRSGGFGASPGNSGVASTGFKVKTASATGSLFGTPPSFGGNPTFGSYPTFGASPSFGAAPVCGAASSFGSPPSFGDAPKFGSGTGGTTFGGSPSFGNTGGSPSRYSDVG